MSIGVIRNTGSVDASQDKWVDISSDFPTIINKEFGTLQVSKDMSRWKSLYFEVIYAIGNLSYMNFYATRKDVAYTSPSVSGQYVTCTFTDTSLLVTRNGANRGIITKILANEVEQTTYLYKDGTQNVPWDNAGTYRRAASWVSDGGATLNADNMTLQYAVSSPHNRAIVTDSVVDFSQYSTLKVASVYGGAEHIKTVNISSIQSSGYVVIQMFYYNSNQSYGVTLSSSKDYYNSPDNRILDSVESVNATAVTITRVWLEK